MTQHLRFVFLAGALALLAACPNPRAVCGNGRTETGEQCDDGNDVSGDGCEADCVSTAAGGGSGTGGGSGGGSGSTGGGSGTGGVCGNGVTDGLEDCDDMNQVAGDGCENDCTFSSSGCGNGKREGAEVCDDGNTTGGDGCEADCSAFTDTAAVKGCPGINTRIPAQETCHATAGTEAKLVTGVILTDSQVLVGGQVLIDASGTITCAACDCSAQAAGATQLTCPRAVVSPGLINSHDHISYQASPQMRTAERYEHRHDWRRGNNGHTSLPSGNSNISTQIRWAELRQVMAGTTSIVGATFSGPGNSGLLRNLDSNTMGQQGELAGPTGVDSDTFPLGDSDGKELTSGCAYGALPTQPPGTSAYLPHVSEGIEPSAHNEFVCLSSANGTGILSSRTALVHAIGLNAFDVALMAGTGSSLVWSPRSNVSLYGDTAAVPLFKRLGVNIALGTDWTISGSMNLLRELKCADSLNTGWYDKALTDQELWRTVTAGGADATQTQASIGRIATGKLGDLAIFKRRAGSFYRSVIDAEPQDVVATVRGGKVLYADQNVLSVLSPTGCDTFDVCGTNKMACISAELAALTGSNAANTYDLLKAANTSTYPLFYCGGMTPQNEPSCVPERSDMSPKGSNSKLGSSLYTAASTDTDKDGVADAMDNCPRVFNPIRPMDEMKQPDADNDGQGDVCDVCPINAGTTTCAAIDPNDRDGDGQPNGTDNCPNVANATQLDTDNDLKGDACDACPRDTNLGNAACPSSIYAVKNGTSPVGQPVSLSNVLVTAVGPAGYFVQVHPSDPNFTGADFSGLYAYQPNAGVTAGDRISIASATPTNYFGQIQLTGALSLLDGGVTLVSPLSPLPPAVVVLPADAVDAGPLEGVLVRVENVTVTSITPDAGAGDSAPTNEFVVDNSLRINDLLYLTTPFPTVSQRYVSISGVLEMRNGNLKLEPRGFFDVVDGPPTLVAVEPSLVYLREGSSTPIPGPVSVRLSNLAIGDTAVTVTSSGPELSVGDGGVVVVIDGGLRAEVPLTAGALPDGGLFTLTATLGADTRTAQVRVVGAAEQPALVSLTPATIDVNAGAVQRFTVTLDLPAAAATNVTVALVPNTLGVAPMTVSVPANAFSASFDVSIAAGATGTGTLSASFGGAMRSSTLTVRLRPTAGDLIISEYGEANSNNKYLELYNGTGSTVNLGDYTIRNNSNGGTGNGNQLTLSGTLNDGEAYVVCNASIAATLKSKCDTTTSTVITFNGNDAVTLLHGTNAIDVIGVVGMDPGTAWAVCGISGGTLDHVLIRKPTISAGTTSWAMSAGTNTTDCQWLVTTTTTQVQLEAANTMGAHSFGP